MAQAQPVELTAVGRTRTLAVDVGGSGLKASVIDDTGRLLTERVRIDTPVGRPPEDIVAALARLVAPLGAYDRVSVGFPGVVREGRVLTAPNLDHEGWKRFDLAGALSRALGKPVRVANDADVQGLAVIAGKGVEMVVTLGTGFGTGLYLDGRPAPHLELSHHPFRKGETYDEQLGNAARKRVGRRKWNRRVEKAIRNLRALTNFDHLYVGGGNARKVDVELDPDVTIVSNDAGLKGGVALWRD
ncbi:MAG TPA: ROK family protein [Methylomirabilota bacterium]|nr:ROK family protein [Methylomirabilota bacterium]